MKKQAETKRPSRSKFKKTRQGSSTNTKWETKPYKGQGR